MTAVWFVIQLFKRSMLVRLMAAGAAAFIAIKGYAFYERGVGKEQLRQESRNAGKAANEKNAKVRSAARKPGAAARVQQEFCRDCD
jgi:hypothetical protein